MRQVLIDIGQLIAVVLGSIGLTFAIAFFMLTKVALIERKIFEAFGDTPPNATIKVVEAVREVLEEESAQ